MILSLSTSSPVVSVAVIGGDEVIWTGCREAPRAASQAALELIQQALKASNIGLEDIESFAADVGPGSFTGTRVGVTIIKTLAFAQGRPASGHSSFDLITSGPAYVPLRKGEYLLRVDGAEPSRVSDPPVGALGYGYDGRESHYPDASRSRDLGVLSVKPEELAVAYSAEPSISQAKNKIIMGQGG